MGWLKTTGVVIGVVGASYGLMALPRQLRKTAVGKKIVATLPGV